MRDSRLEKLAEVLVGYSVGVKPGQLVRISGPPLASPLIIEIYRRVLLAGGHPDIRMAPEELGEIKYKIASDEQLKYLSPTALFEIDKIDCSIGVWAEENTRSLTNVDPKRMGMASVARKPVLDRFLQRAAAGELKWTGTQFPCQAAAQDAEMS